MVLRVMVWSLLPLLFLLLALLPLLARAEDLSKTALDTPYYCVDAEVLAIFSPRLHCLRLGSEGGGADLDLLGGVGTHGVGAVQLQHAHELAAYQWLVRETRNPYRVDCSDPRVRLEYVPLLPLHWVAAPLGTAVQVGGPGNASFACSYAGLLHDIETYTLRRDRLRSSSNSAGAGEQRKLFSVAGTADLRTQMGVLGMSSDARRGPQYVSPPCGTLPPLCLYLCICLCFLSRTLTLAHLYHLTSHRYDAVTSFVTSLLLGHYERFPQCPDLLRRHWPGAIELPHLPLALFSNSNSGSDGSGGGGGTSTDTNANDYANADADEARDIEFLFVGRMWLFGPERVCSVRNAVAALASGPLRASVVVVNTTSTNQRQEQVVADPKLQRLYLRARFCLVAKADSYSTAALYDAVRAGCVPVLLSDWLLPALNWALPWRHLCVRVAEQDFLASPVAALRAVQQQHGHRLPELQQQLRRWAPLLSYAPTRFKHAETLLAQVGPYSFNADMSPPAAVDAVVVPALELLLHEALYHPGTTDTPKGSADPRQSGLTCETPYHCPLEQHLLPPLQLGLGGTGDERSFLCQNVHRLVGQYKMVYNQKCVRILWPLRPGHFKPFDLQRLSDDEKAFVTQFHRIGFSPSVYPYSHASLGGVVAAGDLP